MVAAHVHIKAIADFRLQQLVENDVFPKLRVVGLAIVRKIRLTETPKKIRDLAEHNSAAVRTLAPSGALDNLRLRQNFLRHVSVNVSQTKIAAGVIEG